MEKSKTWLQAKHEWEDELAKERHQEFQRTQQYQSAFERWYVEILGCPVGRSMESWKGQLRKLEGWYNYDKGSVEDIK